MRFQSIGLPILRLALGVILFGMATRNSLIPTPCRACLLQHGLPGYFVSVAGVLEVFGGGLLILGFLTRIAGFLLAVEMAVAIWKVHSGGGYMAVHIYEFPLVLAAACFALATVGAGRVSAD